jgi:hypothetical protein
MVSSVTQYMLHRPPEAGVLIPAESFRTKDGQPGLDVKYYSDDHFGTLCHEQVETNVDLFWYTGWPDYITDPKFSMRWEGRLIPAETGTQWIDFWTGEPLIGGQTITADAPIDKIPLPVRGGSIIPMGPFIQYAAEKPADPIELRI